MTIPAPGEIGHNRVSFDAVVEENLLRGLYLVHLQALQRCIKDPRLDPCDRLVLVALSECTNGKTGMAYPGRAWLARNITYYVNGEPKHYSEGTVANSLSKLVDFGYLSVSRRAPADGSRALSHYALTAPSLEELQAEIAKACALIKANPKRPFPGSDVISRDDARAGNDLSRASSAKAPKNGDFRPDVLAGDDVMASDDVSQPNVIFSAADVINGRGQELVKGTGNTDSVADFGRAGSPPDLTDKAIGLYNAAAQRHGFRPCQAVTEARRKRLRKRIDEIGGLEAFRRALSAIPSDDFLMGRARPRPGNAPFKLDIDKLLQTDGGMGDVLARLLDAAGEAARSFSSGADKTQARDQHADAIARLREEEDTGAWR